MEEKGEQQVYCVWADWDHHIVSFQEAEGFEKITYKTHDEMFFHIIRLIDKDYAIQ